MTSKAVASLSARLAQLPPMRDRAKWPHHEYVKGWSIFALPFDSGHVLALRVFPDSSFAPYTAVWHRDPDGDWSIYVDGTSLDTACPRYFGPACRFTGHARIEITWTGPATVRVRMDSPALEWTSTVSSTRLLGLLNTVSAAMPPGNWRLRPLIRARERLSRSLGMGRLRLRGTMPSGHRGTLMPERDRKSVV